MTMTANGPKRKDKMANLTAADPLKDLVSSNAFPELEIARSNPLAESERTRSLQLFALAIYNRAGERRELKFQIGKVNIITGASLTGKLAIISIVDYCLGRSDFIIPVGVIADSVSWYVLHVRLPNSEAIIGRPMPDGAQSTTAAYLSVGGNLEFPELTSLRVNSNTEALANFLTEALGITANENVPPEGQSRRPLQANINHARFLLFQPQTVIANDKILFYRADEPHIPQTIKDTLPYFLGAAGDDQYERLQQLRRLRRELRLLERRMSDEEALRGQENTRATALIVEAENLGLLTPQERKSELAEVIEVLKGLSLWTPAFDDSPEGNAATTLQDDRERIMEAMRTAQREIDAARSFVAAQDSFNNEAGDQKNRLLSINLYPNGVSGRCPVCEHELAVNVPKAEAIRSSLANLERQMASTSRQRPRLESFVSVRENALIDLRTRLRENKAALEALMAQEEALRRDRSRMVAQAKLIGRISEFIDNVRLAVENDNLRHEIQNTRAKVSTLEEGLSDEVVDDRLNSILQVVGRDMSEWSKRLELEHSQWPVGLDLNARNPTVVAHRETGPVRMFQMGGGKNWMGYHVVTHLALHKFFRERRRPVPGLLMFDQPTQVYYPAEKKPDRSIDELDDEDREAVKRLFRLIFDVTEALSPDLQVIITDHADLNVPWFQQAVVARWRNGEKLVPEAWYTPNPSLSNVSEDGNSDSFDNAR